MTPRSIRRAAERKAKKKALKATEHAATLPQTLTEENPFHEVSAAEISLPETRRVLSPAQLAANQANAQLSTGPKSCEGKSTSSLNAVKTALTGRTVLLPSDDAALYEQHILAYSKELRPLTQRECDLVQSIADTAWRLGRIPALEMAIYALGRVEFAEDFNDHSPAARPSLIELKTFLTYEKQLRNLQLQETRLHRRYAQDTKELRTIQAEREQRETSDLEAAAQLSTAAKHDGQSSDLPPIGFDFSNGEIEQHLEGVRAPDITSAVLSRSAERPISVAQSNSQAA